VAEDSTAVVAEDSTAVVAEDFMEAAEEGFAGAEVSTAEAALVMAADIPSADIVAEATTAVAAVTAGAEDIGVADTVTGGAGDLASGGRIGDGDIRMATATARGITTRLTLMVLTHPTVLRTIPRTIRILTTGTTILRRQVPVHDPRPTRTDPQDPGDPRYRQAQPARTTQTATSRLLRRVGRFSPLTG